MSCVQSIHLSEYIAAKMLIVVLNFFLSVN